MKKVILKYLLILCISFFSFAVKPNAENSSINNDLLRSLKIENYDILFSPNIYEYNIEINDENRLNIVYDTLDDVYVKLTGNSNLKNGSIIVIDVKKDNESYTYKINIKKTEKVFKEEKTKSTFNSYILNDTDKVVIKVIIIGIIGSLIIFIYYLMFYRFKKKKNKH